ncbi:hypothetical protein B0H16DRAFT_959581 [Mycena metata]|uniref:Uncharacterized protein n=1 Tax=Mycena metata TaxID=1033252 RepID=A0AAD7N6C8_9AGAR|nr:hypothetical protein B0H16DRAFT_959581 [Mycena metata]
MIMTFLSVTGKRSPRQRSPLPTSIWPCLFVVAVFLSASAFVGFSPRKFVVSLGQPPTSDICPQEAALFPARNAPIWEATHEETASNAFKTRAIDWLAGAVQIPYIAEVVFHNPAHILRLQDGILRQHAAYRRRPALACIRRLSRVSDACIPARTRESETPKDKYIRAVVRVDRLG